MDADSQLAKDLYNKQFQDFSEKQTAYPVLQDLKNTIYSRYLDSISQKNVLFAGCGDGRECIPAITRGAHVVGIDISEKAIELAHQHCPKAHFFVMDIEKMAFKDHAFDVIISLFVVMYKENLSAVLREFERVLKEDGFILLAVPIRLGK